MIPICVRIFFRTGREHAIHIQASQIQPSQMFTSAISESLEPRRLLASNPTVIDLLVLYTNQAKTDQGGDAAIQSEIQGDVDFTNTAMQNSQIPITIRLVHSQEITGYTAAGSVMQDELNMQGSGNNPTFHAARAGAAESIRGGPGRSGDHQSSKLTERRRILAADDQPHAQ